MSRSLTIFKGQIWEEREVFGSESSKQRDKKAYHTKVPTHQYSEEETIFTLQAKNKIKKIQKNLSPTAQIRKKILHLIFSIDGIFHPDWEPVCTDNKKQTNTRVLIPERQSHQESKLAKERKAYFLESKFQ